MEQVLMAFERKNEEPSSRHALAEIDVLFSPWFCGSAPNSL